MSLLSCVEKYHYTQLSLELLNLSSSEVDAITHPATFFAHYLRQRVLATLAHCDALMTAQAEVRSRFSLHRRTFVHLSCIASPSARRSAFVASRPSSWTA